MLGFTDLLILHLFLLIFVLAKAATEKAPSSSLDIESFTNFGNTDMESIEASASVHMTTWSNKASSSSHCSIEVIVPAIDMVFDTLQEAESFYYAYANSVGFDVRKEHHEKQGDYISSKLYVCNREGKRREPKGNVKFERKVLRVGCPASIKFRRADNGSYVVSHFEESHSHGLVSPSKRKFLKGSRKVNDRVKRALATCNKVNMSVAQTFHLVKVQVGGYENIGCTQKDLSNFQQELRTLVQDSDAQILLDKLNSMKMRDPDFFFEIDYDDDKRMKNIFWADGTCRKNYALFGEVLSFDSTYNTNKYRLIFAPFTGINHHKSCVCFGIALLENEEAVTYEWLFRVFLKAMSGKEPNVIITDEDKSMKRAINNVFNYTNHRLCMWHIMRKIPLQHLSSMVPDYKDFMKRLNSCIWNSETPEEFEQVWPKLLYDNGLSANEWLASKYENRQAWIPAYFKDVFLAGLVRTTSRSESENSFYGRFMNHKVSLSEFWMKFESAMERQRHKENELDNESINKMMALKTESSFEKQASDAFTHEIFDIFQAELLASYFNCSTNEVKKEGTVHIYTIILKFKPREVCYDASTGVVNCSCKMFESLGVPCQHILMVLRNEQVNELSSNLILERWTKKINRKTVIDLDGTVLGGTQPLLCNELRGRVSSIYAKFDQCINMVCQDSDKLEALDKHINAFMMLEDPESSRHNGYDLVEHIGSSILEKIEVHPPKRVRTKGAPTKRLQPTLEKVLKPRELNKCSLCGKAGHNKSTCPTLQDGA